MSDQRAFDASAWTGAWPFTSAVPVSLATLVTHLQRADFTGAAVSPLAAILVPDPMLANRSLIEEARVLLATETPFDLRLVPVLNPQLGGWQRDLADLLADAGDLIGAIRLIPNYHDYVADAAEAVALVRAATAAGLACLVQVRMLDERAQHPRMVVPGVEAAAITRLAAAVPDAHVLACGVFMAELPPLAVAANVSAELSSVESGDTLHDALSHFDAARLLLASHTPLYQPAVARAKVFPSGQVDEIIHRVAYANADRFFQCASGNLPVPEA